MRISGPGVNRRKINFTFEGAQYEANDGETLAAALVAEGQLDQSEAKDGAPRGHYCGMGVCHDCLLTIDGVQSQRACMTKVTSGTDVRRQSWRPAARADNTGAAVFRRHEEVDVLVIGAGPGGLSAALAAHQTGASVFILDERPAPGGQYFKQPGYSGAVPKSLIDVQSRQGKALIDSVRDAGIEIRNSTLVWGAFRTAPSAIEIATIRGNEAGTLRPRVVIVATGAYERPAVVPGWTLPGVMTPGGAQTLMRSYGVVPGSRLVIAGNGPLNLQLADEFRRAGMNSVTVVEAAPPPWKRAAAGAATAIANPVLAAKGLATLAALRLAGIDVLWQHALRRLLLPGSTMTARP